MTVSVRSLIEQGMQSIRTNPLKDFIVSNLFQVCITTLEVEWTRLAEKALIEKDLEKRSKLVNDVVEFTDKLIKCLQDLSSN